MNWIELGASHMLDGLVCSLIIIWAIGAATIVHNSTDGVPLIGSLAISKSAAEPVTFGRQTGVQIVPCNLGQDMVVATTLGAILAPNVVSLYTIKLVCLDENGFAVKFILFRA